jgi:aminoglycoside phosphotransferase (APT) family kinase protein
VGGTDASPPGVTKSSRDPETIRQGLEMWLASRLPDGARPTVTEIEVSSANGMSSDTFLFRAAWDEGGEQRDERLVARVTPDPADVPVHLEYDLSRQFEVIRLVGELTQLPAPEVLWLEQDGGPFGVPFFVMARIDGVVPPDVLPYPFGDNWLYDASVTDQRRLQDSTIAALAELHAIDDPADRFGFVGPFTEGDNALRRHVEYTRKWYEFAAADVGRSPLIERTLSWLEDNWPSDEGPTVLVWGDSRIGNVMYREFEPVGILDWEMARLGPPELDVTWLLYSHRIFDDLANDTGLPGMPGFLRRDDVVSTYESISGHTPRHIDFYCVYAAVQWSTVFLRTGLRSIHFGQQMMPDDADDLILNRCALERMLAGTYWS